MKYKIKEKYCISCFYTVYRLKKLYFDISKVNKVCTICMYIYSNYGSMYKNGTFQKFIMTSIIVDEQFAILNWVIKKIFMKQ